MTRPRMRRDDSAPRGGPSLKILRVKAMESWNVALLGTKVHGFWLHWCDRSEPCTEPQSECEGCQKKWPCRWKGYVYSLREDTNELGFLELTGIGKESLTEQVGEGERMRGQRVKVARGKGDKTRLRFLALRSWHAERPGEPLPEEKDPEETLTWLFSMRPAKKAQGGRP